MQRILFLTMLLIATDAVGAGFAIKDQGTKAMSMAHAFAAVADDASAAWYNPAGIAFQEKSALLVGVSGSMLIRNMFLQPQASVIRWIRKINHSLYLHGLSAG